MTRYQSRHDGEYRACTRCVKLGYAEDAFHPCNGDFWPMLHGRLSYAKCKACLTEVSGKRRGIVQVNERVAA